MNFTRIQKVNLPASVMTFVRHGPFPAEFVARTCQIRETDFLNRLDLSRDYYLENYQKNLKNTTVFIVKARVV